MEEKGNGRLKSRCRGFVQFCEHDHALATLRQLNSNPHVFGTERRPIVEFAIENAKMVKIHDTKVANSKARAQQERERKTAGGQCGDMDGNLNWKGSVGEKSRGQRQQRRKNKPQRKNNADAEQGQQESVEAATKKQVARVWLVSALMGISKDNIVGKSAHSHFALCSFSLWIYVTDCQRLLVGVSLGLCQPRITRLLKMLAMMYFFDVGQSDKAQKTE